jgi:hypothetical protein
MGAPFNGLTFAVANNSGQILNRFETSSNSGVYSVTVTPGTVLTLSALWYDKPVDFK